VSEADDRDARLADLLEQARAGLRAGTFDPGRWQAECPELSAELQGLIGTLRDLETAVDEWRWLHTAAHTATHFGPAISPREELPAQVGRYRVRERLGSGGMGVVYLADDPQLGRPVAVKVPFLDGRLERGEVVGRFLREARAAARAQHPHVCPIHDVGEDGGRPYLVMAYIAGPSLDRRLAEGPKLDDRTSVRLAREMAEALAALHAQGILHRDLKPANVLLDAEGRALLTDFGLARPEDEPGLLTRPGAVLGTPAYMAPEQAAGEGEKVGAWSDLYSLGVILYQMLTGRLPFEGPALAVLARLRTEPLPAPSSWRADLDPALEAIVRRAMAFRPEDRYRDARELATDLAAWEAGRAPTAVLPAPPAAPAARQGTVRVELPDGTPVTVNVDVPEGAKDVAVQVRQRRSKKKGRQLAVIVTMTLTLAMAAFLTLFYGTDKSERARTSGGHEVALRDLPEPPGPPPLVWKQEKKDEVKAKRAPLDGDADKALADARLTLARTRLALARGEPVELVGRHRRPYWCAITYDVETSGAMQKVSLPFVLGALADLSGHAKGPRPPLRKRRWRQIDRDNFDAFLAQVGPRYTAEVVVGGKAHTVDVSCKSLDDFDPRALSGRLGDDLARAVRRRPDYQRLESAWRGLHYLVHQVEIGQELKVRVIDVSRAELLSDLKETPSFERTAVFGKMAEELAVLGGQPVGLLVVDGTFGTEKEDLALLSGLGRVGQALACPMVGAAEVEKGPDWKAFRAAPEAAFVALTVPRVLARAPKGDTAPEELTWMSGAWLLAAQVGEAQARYRWPARLGALDGAEGLTPPALWLDRRGERWPPQTVCTEARLTPVQEMRLTRAGLVPIVYLEKEKRAGFVEAPTCRLPDAAAEARLNVLLCAGRFGQVLAVMAREKVGGFATPAEVEERLNRWLAGYVLASPEKAPLKERAARPLAAGRVRLRAVKGRPWAHELECELRPQFQLEPVPARPVRLVLPVFRRE
jgi:type VI secretion system ImpB/VipA family protein